MLALVVTVGIWRGSVCEAKCRETQGQQQKTQQAQLFQNYASRCVEVKATAIKIVARWSTKDSDVVVCKCEWLRETEGVGASVEDTE